MLNRSSHRVGFTLVELLVVIGVIALLIAILMPALTKARKAAMAIKCASNLRQVFLAESIYANESKGWIGISTAWNSTADGGHFADFLIGGPGAGPNGVPEYKITVYLKDTRVLMCPSALPEVFAPGYGYGFNLDSAPIQGVLSGINVMTHPGYKRTQFPQKFFVPAKTAYRHDSLMTLNGGAFGKLVFANMVRAKWASTGIFLTDSIAPGGGLGAAVQVGTVRLTGSIQGPGGVYERDIHLRHSKGANVLFWDGHVNRVTFEEFVTMGAVQGTGNLIGEDMRRMN